MDALRQRAPSRSDWRIHSRGNEALVITVVLTSLAIFVVTVRMVTRITLVKLVGREDGVIMLSLTFSIVYMALVISQVHFGLGHHQYDLPLEEVKAQLMRLWLAIPMYNCSLWCTKISILFQYLRIFPGRPIRIACYTIMGIVCSYSLWAVVSGYLNCIPVARFWDRSIPGNCLNFEALWFFNAAMNLLTDMVLLILPMPVLNSLQLPRKQRLALMGVFAVGGLVCITSMLRLKSLHQVAISTDPSWDNVGAAFWTAAECNIAIICASLPYLRPLVIRIFPHFASNLSYPRKSDGQLTSHRKSRATLLTNTVRGEYDMYGFNDRRGGTSSSETMGGIQVTTELVQETTKGGESIESSSQRTLVEEV
ncbi:hypothetical protein VTN77DRAFT_2392 [Rasamsonia byssochlamydoides]|uniref:uncharacterized protein n=1 Tax=Rasamsonia byssochlamydoides TaxID=89139 RepID=UPI0037445012